MIDLSKLKVALVCDWITNNGGTARVEEAITEVFPQSDIFASAVKPGLFDWVDSRNVTTSWLNQLPFFRYKHQLFPVFRPMIFENFDLSDYDLVISSCSAESKNVITKPWTTHICYCHTPIRYYWNDYHQYLDRLEFGLLNPFVKLTMPYWVHNLRQTDRLAAERVDYFIGNSRTVAERINKYYRRDAVVINPPVDFDESNFGLEINDGDYFIYVGRLVPHKSPHIVVEAFLENGLPLKVIGNGALLSKLKKMTAGSDKIEILDGVDDDRKRKYMAGCKALIFPSEEDFGIVPVEAMSFGKPVIAYGVGGARETVIEGKTGMHFAAQTPESLNETLSRFDSSKFKTGEIREWAKKFSKERFKKEFKEYVIAKLNN